MKSCVGYLRPGILITLLWALSTLAAGQRYTVQKQGGTWWLLDRDKQPFYSLGVCVVDPGTKWEEYDVNNPSYAAFRYYLSKPEWAADAIKLLKRGGFNTVGAWSSYADLLAVPNNDLKMTPIIHMGSSAGFPWLDMWAPENIKTADAVTKDLLTPLKNDPRIIGYFSDNELGWWKAGVFQWIWKQKTHYERRHVVALLKTYFGGSWKKLQVDFDAKGAGSFDQLAKQGDLCLRPGSKGILAVNKVFSMLAERYYSLCRSIIKKYDPGALYLGDRYISNYYPEVAEQAGKYCDIVSSNLNPNWTDGGYVHYHFDGLTALTHKPLMVTEYYMCSKEGRSGNGNDRSGFPVVDTLQERAQGFQNTTTAFLHNPNIVGAHWFQYYDEPKNGRGDGENYNFGLVDTSNRPYEELLDRSKSLDLRGEHAKAAPFAGPAKGCPELPANPYDMAHWNRDAAYIRPDEIVPRGDLYVAWNGQTLAISCCWAQDLFEDAFYRNAKVPDSDRSTIEIDLPKSNVHWIATFYDTKAVAKGPQWKFEFKPGTASQLIVQIPASALGHQRLMAGLGINLKARLISETRSYTTTWHVNRPLGK